MPTHHELLVWSQAHMLVIESARREIGRNTPSLSLWKSFKNLSNLSLFLRRMLSICGGFFGLATNTCDKGQPNSLEACLLGTDLKHVECFELDVLALVPKEIHHHLEIRLARNIPGHHIEVRTIQQDLSKQLQRLSLRDVIARHN